MQASEMTVIGFIPMSAWSAGRKLPAPVVRYDRLLHIIGWFFQIACFMIVYGGLCNRV